MSATSRLGLGTVQWGMDYGIANNSGKPGEAEVREMLGAAMRQGVDLLDTARGYGDSEQVLGDLGAAKSGFRIVTKTQPIRSASICREDVDAVVGAFEESLRRLDAPAVYGLMVHHADNLLAEGGDLLWHALLELKARGLATRLGVSVYDPLQVIGILDRYAIDLVQLPFNYYDQRFLVSGLLQRLKALGVEIHARSAFLQGLLLITPERLPTNFAAIRTHQARLHSELSLAGATPLEGALGFCLEQPEVDHVIVGCESSAQLEEILRVARNGVLPMPDSASFALTDESIINPSRWAN